MADRWVIRFNTGGYGNSYGNKQDAFSYAMGANRYSMANQGEEVVVAVEHYRNGEKVGEYSPHADGSSRRFKITKIKSLRRKYGRN